MTEVISLQAKISALLFVSPKPIGLQKISDCLEVRDIEDIREALNGLKELYLEDIHGFSLHEINGRYQFRTATSMSDFLRKLHPQKLRKISRAAAETLAIIAYKQPVQRAEIESIRGVDPLPTLKTLIEAKLVKIVGKEDVAGTPDLYGTTDMFLEKFGMNDLSDLPSIKELEELEVEPGELEVAESLEAVSEEICLN